MILSIFLYTRSWPTLPLVGGYDEGMSGWGGENVDQQGPQRCGPSVLHCSPGGNGRLKTRNKKIAAPPLEEELEFFFGTS